MATERIRYRRVSTRMWNDRKFLELSAPKPNARDLWVWLIAGPLTTPVPGVVLTTLGGIADRLAWPVPATRRCWAEIADREMATADWSHSLVWLPNALEHNPPESPNVVKAWRTFLEQSVPECPLRATLEAGTLSFLRTYRKSNGEGFGPGFLEAFGKAYGEAAGVTFALSGTGTGDTGQGTAALTHRDFHRAVEISVGPPPAATGASVWKRAVAIAHAVMDACPERGDWTSEFKTRCRQQGIDYGQRDERHGTPLFARAIDYVEGVRARRKAEAS